MRILLFIGLIFFLSCQKPTSKTDIALVKTQEKKVFNSGLVSADNLYEAARLNDFKKLNDSTYQAIINPENTPVNSSPWFGFRIWSEVPARITLEIVYPSDYTHRYIPKISNDGIHWEACSPGLYELDSTRGTAKLALHLSPEKLWLSAQENLNAAYIHDWMDSLALADFIQKEAIGKSVLGQDISLLRIRKDNPTNAIIIIGRQHPPEVPGGTMSLVAFLQAILSESEPAKDFLEKFEVLAFPLLNPDGVIQGHWRHNANGKDLNRDWIQFSEPETQAVRDYLEQERSPENATNYCFGIDFHTSYSGPYLLTLDTLPHKVEPVITNQWIHQIESSRNEQLDIRPRAQDLPYCYNWMINELGIEAVTYEEGDEIDRATIRKRAEDYAQVLMEILLEKY